MGSGGLGNANIGVGIESLRNNTTGRTNVAIGNRAMRDNLSGAQNVTIGTNARMLSTAGHDNIAIGFSAMSNVTPLQSVAIGTYALAGDGNGGTPYSPNSNIGIGNNSLRGHTSNISNNTAVGFGALQLIGGGNNNVAIGHRAGQSTSGSGNIFIGFESGRTQNGSNQLMIDNENTAVPLIKGDFAGNTVTVNGNLGVGNTSFGGSASRNVLAFGNGTRPNAATLNHAFLFVEAGELKVQDGSGNVTTLSPHDFSLIPGGPSEPLAWAYHSQQDGQTINVDMLKAIRLLESLSGEQLVYISGSVSAPSEASVSGDSGESLATQVKALAAENKALRQRLDGLEQAR